MDRGEFAERLVFNCSGRSQTCWKTPCLRHPAKPPPECVQPAQKRLGG
jgi:hypothetical protein